MDTKYTKIYYARIVNTFIYFDLRLKDVGRKTKNLKGMICRNFNC